MLTVSDQNSWSRQSRVSSLLPFKCSWEGQQVQEILVTGHGRFLCDSRTFFGMHSSIMLMKFEYHLSQERFMSSINKSSHEVNRLYYLTRFAPVSVGIVPDCTTCMGVKLPSGSRPLFGFPNWTRVGNLARRERR